MWLICRFTVLAMVIHCDNCDFGRFNLNLYSISLGKIIIESAANIYVNWWQRLDRVNHRL